MTTNVVQLLDPVGHLQRHYFAPRASTQDMMNLKMQGQVFELAERYTNMTKILFLSLWYCSIYPGALFMCAFILFVNYFVGTFLVFTVLLLLSISHILVKYRSVFPHENLEKSSSARFSHISILSSLLFPLGHCSNVCCFQLLLVRLPIR